MLHETVRYVIVLLGFALLGIVAGAFVSVTLGVLGVVFQLLKVMYLFAKAIFGKEGIKDVEEDDLISPLYKQKSAKKISFP